MIFQRVYDLFASEKVLVAFANSKGENIAAGDIAVAQKFAALAAANGAAYLHVLMQYGVVREEDYLRTLRKIAANDMTLPLARIADYTAHLTWLAGQPFRGSEKIPRIAQFTFTSLPSDEIAKDREHIVDAAQFLVDWLSTEPAAVAAE